MDAVPPPPASVPSVTAQAAAALEPLLEELLTGLAPVPQPPGAGRPRILPSLCLWTAVLVCLVRGAQHQNAVWRLLTRLRLWHYPRFALSDQAIYRRLEREAQPDATGSTPLQRLFIQVCAVLRTRLAPYADGTLAPFARAVFAVDETTLDQVPRWLPALRGGPPHDTRRLPGKLLALFDLRRQVWHTVLPLPNPHQHEKVSLPTLLTVIEAGSLLVFDLGYFSFAWFDALTAQQVWWVSRLRAKTSYTVQHVFYQRDDTLDALVWLGRYRADRAQQLVRLVTFRVGLVQYTYLTNQLDPAVCPLHAVAGLYQRRWDVELAFKLVKQYLGLHLLWSSKPAVVLAQVWGVLCISQVLQALRLEIAARAEVDVFAVSLPLLVEYAPQYVAEGQDPVVAFVADGRRLGFIRPSPRTENRAPVIPVAALTPRPADLPLTRPPRYAQRKCGPRPRTPRHPAIPPH